MRPGLDPRGWIAATHVHLTKSTSALLEQQVLSGNLRFDSEPDARFEEGLDEVTKVSLARAREGLSETTVDLRLQRAGHPLH